MKQTLESCMVDMSKPISPKDDFSVDWEVTANGNMIHRDYAYLIEACRLTEKDWIKHMLTKGWIDMNTFIPAYFYALRIIGVKEVTITANYSLESDK